jgi:hypothetical protein
MRTLKTGFLILLLVLGIFTGTKAQNVADRTALPYPTADTPPPVDRGALRDLAGTTPITVTVALSLRDLDAAENLLKSLHTAGDPQFHQFLTADEFVSRYAPTDADVAKVIAALAKYGLKAQRTTATTLEVTGTPAAMESAFVVSLHSYEVPAWKRPGLQLSRALKSRNDSSGDFRFRVSRRWSRWASQFSPILSSGSAQANQGQAGGRANQSVWVPNGAGLCQLLQRWTSLRTWRNGQGPHTRDRDTGELYTERRVCVLELPRTFCRCQPDPHYQR